MTTTYRVLGQTNPAANTLTTLYTVPSSTQTIISTVTVCNQSANTATFKLAVRPFGAAIDPKHYINFGTPIPGNDSISVKVAMTLGATDVVSVNASSSLVSFNAFGSELS
jgi:hypothetical protein